MLSIAVLEKMRYPLLLPPTLYLLPKTWLYVLPLNEKGYRKVSRI
jgi:hypothetical protein